MSSHRHSDILLYDGTCGLCSRLVPAFTHVLQRRGIRIAPLQTHGLSAALALPANELLADFRLLHANGTQTIGADVYRFFMRHIWWAYPAYLLSQLPLWHHLFNYSYRTFANNRHRFSRTCRIPPQHAP